MDHLSKIRMVSKGLSNREIKMRVMRIFSTLVSDLDADRLSDFLIEGLIIAVDQWQEIQHRHLTKQGRCRELLTTLIRMKNPRTFIVFMEALQRNPQWHWIIELILNQDSPPPDGTDDDPDDSETRLMNARMEWEREKEELLEKQMILEQRLHELEIAEIHHGNTLREDEIDGRMYDPMSNSETIGFDEIDWKPMSRNYSFKSVKSESLSRCSSSTRLSFGRSIVCGKIQLQLSYNEVNRGLEVTIVQCRGLAAVDRRHRRSDPYVKLYLMQDESKIAKRKTAVAKNDLNPMFMAPFWYSLTLKEMETYTLWISVWHKVKFGRNRFLGEVVIPVDANLLNSSIDDWYFLEKPMRRTIR